MNEGIVPNDLRQSVEDIISGKKSLYQINTDTFNHAVVNVKAVYEKNVTKVVESITRKKLYLFNVEESKEILWDVIFLSKIVKNQAQEDKYGNKIINSSYYKDIFNQKFDINNLDSKINKVQLLLVSADLEENVKKEIKEAIVILNDLRNALAHNDNSSYETDEENEQIKFHSDSKGSELYCDIPVRYLLKLGSGIVPLPEHEKLARETDIFIDYTCTNLNINLKELPNFFYRAKPENINYLLSICDYDYTKLKNLPDWLFFSKVEKLKWLIDNYFKVNDVYDISKLGNLPSSIFKLSKKTLKWLIENYCKEEDKYDISKLNDMPYWLFDQPKVVIKELIENYCKVNDTYDISKLKDLPSCDLYICRENIKWLIENYCKVNDVYDISKLHNFSLAVFTMNKKNIKLLIENYCKVNDTYDISKLKDLPDCDLTLYREKIQWLIENYCKIDDTYDMSELKYLTDKILDKPKEIIKWLIENYCKEDNTYNISKLKYLHAWLFELDKREIKLLIENYCKVDNRYDLSRLEHISIWEYNSWGNKKFEKIKQLIDIYYRVYDVNDISKLEKLPAIHSHFDVDKIEWLIENYCKDDDIYDLSKLKDLPSTLFLENEKRLEWLIENYCKEDDRYDISKLNNLPCWLFTTTQEKVKYIIDRYYEIYGVYDMSNRKDLPELQFSFDIDKIQWINKKYFEDNIIEPKELPYFLFPVMNRQSKYEKLKREELTDAIFYSIIKKIQFLVENYFNENNISDLKDLDEELFFQDIEKIKWIIENYCKEDDKYDISKLKDLPEGLFTANIERIKWIVENYCISNGKYDISKLKGIPSELFECDIKLLEQINKHNDMNLLKSVLGNGNDKLVALIIYMDSLFSAYDVKRKVTNLDLMNIEFDKVHPNIQSGVDSINRSYNSSNFDNAKEDYFLGDLTEMVKMLFRQFDKMGVQINEEGITNELINSMDDKIQGINVNLVRMLRNASQHFRVEVDEENPNMLIISDYEKEFDFGTISKNVKSIVKISIEDFYKLLKSIELNNEQEKTTEENYAINNLGNNLLQKVKDKYEDIKKYPNKMLTTSFLHTCLKIEGYNSRKVNVNGLECISYTNGEDIFTDTVDNLYETYSSINKTEVFNAATLFIELLEFDKNELLLQDLFDINLIAEELLIADGINYSKKFQNNEVIFEIDGKTKKSINIYKSYKNNKNKTHVFSEVLINECRSAYGIVYSRIR